MLRLTTIPTDNRNHHHLSQSEIDGGSGFLDTIRFEGGWPSDFMTMLLLTVPTGSGAD